MRGAFMDGGVDSMRKLLRTSWLHDADDPPPADLLVAQSQKDSALQLP